MLRRSSSWKRAMTVPPASCLWDPSKALRFGPGPQAQHVSLGAPFLGRLQSTTSMSPGIDSNTSRSASAADLEHAARKFSAPPQTNYAASSRTSRIVKIEDDESGEIVGGASTDIPDGGVVVQVPLPNPSTFHIPPDKLKEAMAKGEGEDGSYWSHLLYQKLGEDGTPQNVKVHYCTSKHTTEQVCQKYFLGEKVLGFDLEWFAWAKAGASVRQNVSLIQIASPSRIGLFHVARFPNDDYVAPTLKKIMEDASVSKVGVWIMGDCTRLKKYLDIDAKGIVELSHLYKVVKHCRNGTPSQINKRLVPLATQVEDVLKLPLYKGDVVRSSDWSKPLNAEQLKYSAADAYAGVQLYLTLDQQRRQLSPVPPLPHHAEKRLPLQAAVKVAKPKAPPKTSTGPDAESQEAKTKAPGAQKEPKAEPAAPANPYKTHTKISSDRDARVLAADALAREHRAKSEATVTPPSALRAYYLWHSNKGLDPDTIAKLLRDPPLQIHTVSSYILNAIAWDNLPYDIMRMTDELLAIVHPNVILSQRYSRIMKECGVPQPEKPPTLGAIPVATLGVDIS
ncbi:hypothetical protein N3K66_006761 [Trichothecium roseum]|uniref:Uncharacterized protein n=1 Tax=Trichothecium roseum TaxID=47278 RepID=A0ACC0UW97_9HYPO|nr:hypothetical protein N3K66_006761 [Trichothecium roseum]